MDPARIPYARALNLYLHMIREWASKDTLDEIDERLATPPGWINPVTGLPDGFTDDEDDDWAAFQKAMRS